MIFQPILSVLCYIFLPLITADGLVVHPGVSKQVIGRWRDDQMFLLLVEPSTQATTLR